jgi:hypothetical protein
MSSEDVVPHIEQVCPVRAVTEGPHGHLFGYYDKPPWDVTGRYMLAMEAPDVQRMPLPLEKAAIGLVEIASGRFEPLAQTAAWNWQQGCMAQWMPTAPDRQIIYNDVQDGRHVAIVLDIHSGRQRVLPRPIYTVSHDGAFALSTSFARLSHTRPVVGYFGVSDPWEHEDHPSEDGIFRMDLATGKHRLVLSIDQVVNFQHEPSMDGVKHRFEHVVVNPDGSRFFLLHRWPRARPTTPWGSRGPGRLFADRLISANTSDGGDLHLLCDDFVSHFDWRDPTHLLVFGRRPSHGDRFYLFTDRSARYEPVGDDVLTSDGHCTYSPDRRWILADSYPHGGERRTVLLYEVATNTRIDVGHFASPPPYNRGDIRCDLHPRWNRNGTAVCIDSVHEGSRQMYVIDVSAITGPT